MTIGVGRDADAGVAQAVAGDLQVGSPRFRGMSPPTRPAHDATGGHHSKALAAKLSALTNPYAMRLSTPSLLLVPSSRPFVTRPQR